MDNIVLKTKDFRSEDLNQVVALHREQINQGFLSSLGDRVLKLMFESLIESKHCFLIAAIDASRSLTCGFLCGTIDIRKLYMEFMAKNIFHASLLILPKLLTVHRIFKIFETMAYPMKFDQRAVPRAEFLDFALKTEYQGTGLAQRMFYEAVDFYHSMGIKAFKSVVNESLVSSQRFHEKMGARNVAQIQIHKGQNSIVYVFDVNDLAKSRICSI